MSTPLTDDKPGGTSGGGAKTLIMVHGGGHKPDRTALEALWLEALAAGLQRDYADAGGRALLDLASTALVYYGDLINPLVVSAGNAPDPVLDLEDRRRDLRRLAALSARKDFRLAHYEAVPGKSAVPELLADVGAPILALLNLTGPVLARRLPALGAYLKEPVHNRGGLRAACEQRLLDVLAPALARGDDVLLLSHGMGSVVSHDALWRLSHDPASSAGQKPKRVRTWVTMGSPLASDYVKRRLRGAAESGDRRHHEQVIDWLNVAAEDDYYCHDKTVANDFAALLTRARISRIRDYRIYNLAVRYGRSNPHNAVGYLVHPRVAGIVSDWLSEGS